MKGLVFPSSQLNNAGVSTKKLNQNPKWKS